MKTIFRVLIFILLSVSAKAQYAEITTLGTPQALGTYTATVTSGGSVTTWTSWCTTVYNPPSYQSYWVGELAAGWYKFTMNKPVYGLKVYSYAINGGPLGAAEYLELYINGAPYSLTAADMTSYTDCPTPGSACYLYPIGGVNVIMGPTPTESDYSGGDFIVPYCAGINSFELYSNGNEAGVTYYVFVDTINSCNNATVNSPCLGSALMFNNPGDSTGGTYVWLGPNSYTTTVATTQSFTITPSVWSDTGTYYVIKTIGGVTDTAHVHVTIYPVPVISGPTNVCEGSTITLTSTVAGSTWSSSSTAIATVGASTGVVTGVSPGTVTITATAAGGCTDTYIVTVNPLAPITGVATVCVGNTTLFSNTVPGGTWSSSNTLVATVNTTGLVSGISVGTAIITYTTPAGCVSTKLVTVSTFATITGSTVLCAGGTTTLDASLAGCTWSSSNTAVATIGLTSGVVTGVSPGSTLITCTTSVGCVSTVTVNVIILTTISGAEIVCQGSTTTLADGSGGGIWSSTNTGVATIGAGSGVVTGVSGGTTMISYTGGGGCFTTAVVTVNPLPDIPGVSNSSPICADSLLSLFASDVTSGVTYTWSGPASFTSTLENPTIPDAQTGNAGTYNVVITIPATGCNLSGSTIVIIKPTPGQPSIPPIIPPCDSASLNFTANDVLSGCTYSWSGPAGFSSATQTNMIYPAILGTNDGTYTVTATLNGCPSIPATVTVVIIPKPAPPLTRDSIFCSVTTPPPFNFQVDSATGSNLKWYIAVAGGTPIGIPQPPNSVNYPDAHPWYYVSQVVNGCESNRAEIMDTIVPSPDYNIQASNTWVCDHDTLSFSFNNLDPSVPMIGATYLWILPPGTTVVGGSMSGTSIMVRFDTVYGQHIVSLKVGELNYMCDSTVSIPITVIALPSANAHMNPNICIGDTVNLALSYQSPTASVFSWFIDGTPLGVSSEINIVAANSNSGGPFSLSWNDSGMHYITVTCVTEQGCKSLPTYDTVDVHALPDATFTFKPKSPGSLCLEDSVQFFANYVNYNCAYLWQPVTFFSNTNQPQAWGKLEDAQSDIVLTVTDPFGCAGNASQQIDPSSCCTVLFPNAFTPNGDQKNDVFRPLFNGYHNFHSFIIVNRWGQIVFESANSNPAWDGNFNGVPQDIGTYFYYLKYDCGGNTLEAKGDVTLIR